MLSAEGSTLLNNKDAVLEKLAEHFTQHLSSVKALGADAIPVAIYKTKGLPMSVKLTEFVV